MHMHTCLQELISLAGLEHCILRAPLTNPTSYIAGVFLPTSRYACALTHPEPRINFALNCGSLSLPAHVPVYEVPTLDETLEEVSRQFLAERVHILGDAKTIMYVCMRACVRACMYACMYARTGPYPRRCQDHHVRQG